jgi:hypothetical protein
MKGKQPPPGVPRTGPELLREFDAGQLMNYRSIQMRALDRQAYEHASRVWIATLDANITAVFFYDSLRSVQSETKTLARWPGGEEWFKNPVV